MPAQLRCPACAAPFDPPDAGAEHVRCPYCGTSALLRDARAAADLVPPAPPPHRRAVLAAAAALVAIAGIATFALLPSGAPPAGALAPPTPTPVAPVPAAPAGRGPMEPAVRFGREGTGAGGLDDARAVAVGLDGRIYVGEYSGGRIQAFDSAGTFLHQWHADRGMPMLDLEVDVDGVVHVLQGSRVRRFRGATGEPLDDLPRSGRGGFEDLAPVLDGGFWAIEGFHGLARIDGSGRVVRRLDLREVVDGDAAPGRVAVTGGGEVFVTDRWKGEVYRLHPDGRFADRFGPAGGAFSEVAVDGAGRVFVSGMDGIRVFRADGTPLGTLGAPDVVFGVAADDPRGMLFGAYRNHAEIRGYRLPPP